MVKKLNLAGDEVYMKRDWLGWRQIYPLKNSDGSWNYPNLLFGGYRNLIFLVLMLLAMSVVIVAYKHDTKECQEFMELKNQKEFACSICYGVEVIDTNISFTIEPYKEFIQNQNP